MAIGKFERVVIDMQFRVHLSKASLRCANFRFARPDSKETKTTIEFDVIVDRDLVPGSRHTAVWFSNCREVPRQGIGARGERPTHAMSGNSGL